MAIYAQILGDGIGRLAPGSTGRDLLAKFNPEPRAVDLDPLLLRPGQRRFMPARTLGRPGKSLCK